MSTDNKNVANLCPVCESPMPKLIVKPLSSTDEILKCLDHFRNKRQEYFICLSLDSRRRLIERRIVTIGLLDMALTHPREVFAGPLTDRAASIIIAHNHPSGEAMPSQEDIKTTQQLIAAGQIMKLPLLDHFIITRDSYYSFRQQGLM